VLQEVLHGGDGRRVAHEKSVDLWDSQKIGRTDKSCAGDGDGTVIIARKQFVKALIVSASAGDDSEFKRRSGQ
jgi:hypothetical protein